MQKLLPGAHFEIRIGDRVEARGYCLDPDKREPGTDPVELGLFGAPGSRTELDDCIGYLRDHTVSETNVAFPAILAKYPSFVETYSRLLANPREWKTHVSVYIGKTGTGKTRKAHSLIPRVWTKPPGPWYDGYSGQENVLIDDFDGRDIPFRFLLQLLDRYPLLVPVKGSFANWKPRRIVITSNIEVEEWYVGFDNAPLLRRIDDTEYFV